MSAFATSRGDSDPQNEIVLDSLPYVETVHEDYEEYALALIEEEMKSITPRSLKKMLPLQFRTPILKTEFDALELIEDESTGERRVLNSQRSSKDANGFQPLKIARPTSIEEWKSHALQQIKSRFESERLRGLVLEAEKEEAVQNWKDYNTSLEALKVFWARNLKERNEAVEEINFQRQQAQTQNLGPEIDRLNQEYQQALYRRNQLEHAIEAIRRQRGMTSTDEEN
jgi:Breast carcinoma amplified sequence 2 (BCAS2)